jgi:membrane-associated phospholipid phosphatase
VLSLISRVCIISLGLSGIAAIAASPHGLPFLDAQRILLMAVFALVFLGLYLGSFLLGSVIFARQYLDRDSGHVNVMQLFRERLESPTRGVVGVLIASYGILGAQSLSELYRIRSSVWYDGWLWALEGGLLVHAQKLPQEAVVALDGIYFAMWPFILGAAAVAYLRRQEDLFQELLLAAILAFYLTRLLGLLLPSAGPVFYVPHEFPHVVGTVSASAQELLRDYMGGLIPQNGLLPGTMAMPSLHVALMSMASVILARVSAATAWFSVPATLLVWVATVVLGWHYAVDGIGGLAIGWLSIRIAGAALCPADKSRSSLKR